MVLPSFGMDLVVTSVVVLVLAGMLSAFHALVRRQQPVYALVAVAAALAAVAILFAGPQLAQAKPAGIAPVNLTADANLGDRWMQDRDMWGESIGEGFTRGQVLVWPFTYGWMGYHPNIPDRYWRIQGLNLGLELAKYYGVEIEESPVTPPVIAAYLAQLNKRGIDTLYWLGHQRTTPLNQGDGSYWVFFDKAVLKLPASNLDVETDPAAVVRLPAGAMLWSIVQGGGATALDPWTGARKLLAVASLLLLMVSVVPWRRGNDGGIDF